MQYIGFGDLHFDKLDGLIEDVNGKIAKSIRRVLNYALDHGVRTILQYGDVCDRPVMSYAAHKTLMKIVMAKKYKDLDFHFILGNHDFAENGSNSLELIETFANLSERNFKVYTSPEVVKLEGRKFHMMPHPCVETLREAMNIGHFEVNGSYRDNGRKVDHGVQTKHMGCFGHLHTPHRVKKIHFSGTLYQTNFGESLPKSFHHVTYDDEDPYSAEVLDIPFEPEWKLLNVNVESESDLKVIVDDPNVLYKLFIIEGLDLDLGDVLAQHPNIVRHNKFKNKADLKELIENEWDFSQESFVNNVDTQEVVESYLAKKAKLSKKEIKRAFLKLDEITKRTQKEPS